MAGGYNQWPLFVNRRKCFHRIQVIGNYLRWGLACARPACQSTSNGLLLGAEPLDLEFVNYTHLIKP
jgi:hypothetical protein